MGKSEQTGGGGTEPKPKQKRPWRKPRVRLVEFAATKGSTNKGANVWTEDAVHANAYDPNLS